MVTFKTKGGETVTLDNIQIAKLTHSRVSKSREGKLLTANVSRWLNGHAIPPTSIVELLAVKILLMRQGKVTLEQLLSGCLLHEILEKKK